MPCKVSKAGTTPIPTEPLAPVADDLLRQTKEYQLLTCQAAVYGDRKAAYQAMPNHLLGSSADQIQGVLDDLLETNRKHLPQFWA